MSANVNLIQATDGQFYYQANDGHLYPYLSLACSSSTYTTNQQYPQDANLSEGSTHHGEAQYDEEEAEAGRRSFQGDQHISSDGPRKGSSFARKRSGRRVTEYVKDEKERRYRYEPHENSRASLHNHKKSTKKSLEEIMKPFKG
ncbi:hypothetical protein CI238_01860 [Colletotrichum incanum]|uniref:Uncharacterized protein n=1 Tax=Colletotrichum incanum TaxID=1573173 RepID=A0A167B3N3_COLIC|nr:hypothetical protein CI238_01860 [Colletotrichum incanum]OHW94216.1 hypothetical protein CSPAE12_07132 [Colletotrichum incanum]